MIWFWVLIYAIAFGVVTALAAHSRGRDSSTWFLLGFLFGVFALVAVLVMEPQEPEDDDWTAHSYRTKPETPTTKKCPDCAEDIRLGAKVCRFCGKRFEESASSQPEVVVDNPGPVQVAPEHRARTVRCPHCYSMNYSDELLCSSCGKDLD